jgi:hypothetical protein
LSIAILSAELHGFSIDSGLFEEPIAMTSGNSGALSPRHSSAALINSA